MKTYSKEYKKAIGETLLKDVELDTDTITVMIDNINFLLKDLDFELEKEKVIRRENRLKGVGDEENLLTSIGLLKSSETLVTLKDIILEQTIINANREELNGR